MGCAQGSRLGSLGMWTAPRVKGAWVLSLGLAMSSCVKVRRRLFELMLDLEDFQPWTLLTPFRAVGVKVAISDLQLDCETRINSQSLLT